MIKAILFGLTALTRKLRFLSLTGISFFSVVQAAPPPNSFGVWDRGDSFDPKEYSFLKGFSLNQSWSDVEQQPGVFDWSRLDRAMAKALARDQFVYLSLGVGPEAPEWIYSHGVPAVTTDGALEKHLQKWPRYPYYLAPEYKSYFQRLITEFGNHIRSYPQEKQERIAFIQIKTGCTGDEVPYKGVAVEKRYDLPKSSKAWLEFRLETFALFVRIFQENPGHPRIDLLFQDVGANDDFGEIKANAEEWEWVTSHIKGSFGIKNGALSRGHHLMGERSLYEHWTPYLVAPQGRMLFRRSEMDQTWLHPLYQLNVPLNFYWGAVNALAAGQGIWDVNSGALAACKDQGFDYSFHFFNRYAGQIHPETATGAFCALHKGLDAADKGAYPEENFGKASKDNVDRMLKICAAFANYGAAVDDKNALLLNQVRQRDTQRGFNDVGWDIWPDNYSRFLYQIDADATSIPLWRVGGPITPTSSIYSRFARSFEHASGKDAMYFKLHDGFSQDATPKIMSITVVWYDGQAGSTWKLDYDAGTPTMKTAVSVTGKGDKKWHHEVVTLRDAVLRHGGIKGADLALVNTDAKDDVFSLIEVHRGEPELPALHPPTDARAFPGYGKGTKYGKEAPSEEADKMSGDEKRAKRKKNQ
jgi:hypothetical protein